MTKQILVLGGDGQLGQEIKRLHPHFDGQAKFTFTTHQTLDVTNTQQLINTIGNKSYDYIINCTAYTAVDKAEEDTELAYKVNCEAPAIIGEKAAKAGIKVIHVSTDYVFDGTAHMPYIETDSTSPQSVYGKSKLVGEERLLSNNPQSIVLRTSWLYSEYGANFVKTMIRLGKERDELGVIYDQVGTPTYAGDLAETILHIIKTDIDSSIPFVAGIYHYSNEGVASWYDFTLAIHREKSISCIIKPIESKEYPTPAPRPKYSVLNKGKIKKQYSVEIPYWLDSLKKCLSNMD